MLASWKLNVSNSGVMQALILLTLQMVEMVVFFLGKPILNLENQALLRVVSTLMRPKAL
jgi:hypothetical protein